MAKKKKNINDMSFDELVDSLNELKQEVFNIKIQKAWENAVEKKILDYTKEIYVKGDILYIKVSNPILKQEILYSRQKVINLINEELEKDLIKKIVLK